VKVSDWRQLAKGRTILATNLPFERDQADIIAEFEVYGPVSKYAVDQGRILIEFQNAGCLEQAMDDGDFEWGRRTIRISPMTNGFRW
jgi:hypothetical protein